MATVTKPRTNPDDILRRVDEDGVEFIRFWFTDIWPEGYTSQRIYDEYGNPIIAGRIGRVRERE